MSMRMREINDRVPIQKLTKPVQQQLKIYQRFIGPKPDSIDVESASSSLPKELKRNIKSELCLELLKNETLRSMGFLLVFCCLALHMISMFLNLCFFVLVIDDYIKCLDLFQSSTAMKAIEGGTWSD